ncbi:MAG: hypothetical protein CMH25_00525 [Micavibrio sp.]|nr:hypothetical protein [Micavibrio sp.]|tara:strand:+ start:37 stop:444 length:408 start_codon:yes stop_codon:yes gene_type:complete
MPTQQIRKTFEALTPWENKHRDVVGKLSRLTGHTWEKRPSARILEDPIYAMALDEDLSSKIYAEALAAALNDTFSQENGEDVFVVDTYPLVDNKGREYIVCITIPEALDIPAESYDAAIRAEEEMTLAPPHPPES